MAKSQSRLIQSRLNVHARRTRELVDDQHMGMGVASKQAFAEINDGTLKDDVKAEYDRLTERRRK